MEDFIPTLFAGLNVWIFLSASADGGTSSFLGAEGYLKQTNVNAQIFPIRNVLVNFMNLVYSIVAFILIYAFLKPQMFNFNMLMIIPGLVIILLFAISLSNIAAVFKYKRLSTISIFNFSRIILCYTNNISCKNFRRKRVWTFV